MEAIYRPLTSNGAPLIVMNRRAAELTKYAANAFLATKISFINEMADICEAVGADVQELARGIGLDGRIGPKFLHPGPGYGGSCFPKDTLALLKTAQDFDVDAAIVSTVVKFNDDRKNAMAARVAAALGGDVKGKTIGILGLTFKPNTDDMRDAPSIPLVQGLIDAGANVVAHDPVGTEEAKKILHADLAYVDEPYAVAKDADAIVICTEWDSFRGLSLERMKSQMRGDALVDLRNVYERAEAERAGLSYFPVGR